jgi:hypothetical protein
MKCGHPMCQRGIGLVSHRRGWFGKRLYCSRACRDTYVAEVRPSRATRSFEPSLFELLLAQASASSARSRARGPTAATT